MIFSFIFEMPTLPTTFNGWFAILALIIVCSALGFTLQIVAQKYISAAKTGLIFSLEPVFAAIFGILFAGESIAFISYFGAAFVLSSILISSLKKTADITPSLSTNR